MGMRMGLGIMPGGTNAAPSIKRVKREALSVKEEEGGDGREVYDVQWALARMGSAQCWCAERWGDPPKM